MGAEAAGVSRASLVDTTSRRRAGANPADAAAPHDQQPVACSVLVVGSWLASGSWLVVARGPLGSGIGREILLVLAKARRSVDSRQNRRARTSRASAGKNTQKRRLLGAPVRHVAVTALASHPHLVCDIHVNTRRHTRTP
jgi:hypothetical protein